jgi:hypothetical protein
MLHAVHVAALVRRRLLAVHLGEEPDEEGVHGRDAAGDADVVAEQEPAGGRDEARHGDEEGQLAGVLLPPARPPAPGRLRPPWPPLRTGRSTAGRAFWTDLYRLPPRSLCFEAGMVL